QLHDTARAIEQCGATALTLELDVRNEAAVLHAFESLRGSTLDVLVNNAGAGGGQPIETTETESWRHILDTNVWGTFLVSRHAVPLMRGGGRIVNLSSVLGRFGVPGYTAYCASKAGLLGLVRAFAAELAPRKIQVNAVCPGWVNTDMAWDGLSDWPGKTADEAWAIAVQEVPLRRMSEPAEIAATVAWLASADALGVTGQAIDHNNGAFM
ncbi:MAG TPA: SDR family NAD(P)-dependent oxidoreductase, partial [Vicinamibacterales bacterium]|nr:SDR family NAD(P)-dependent oxidoreductase [Vicinamibacterales bacterium]